MDDFETLDAIGSTQGGHVISALLKRFFGSDPSSRDEAKKRLQLLLIHDQLDLSPEQMADMKADIMAVVSRYLEVDEGRTNIRLDRGDNSVQLVSSVPVSRVLKRSPRAAGKAVG